MDRVAEEEGEGGGCNAAMIAKQLFEWSEVKQAWLKLKKALEQ